MSLDIRDQTQAVHSQTGFVLRRYVFVHMTKTIDLSLGIQVQFRQTTRCLSLLSIGITVRSVNVTDEVLGLYDAELERMNNAMLADNQALQNDNRQLIGLIREYEQAVENVMTLFRTRAVCDHYSNSYMLLTRMDSMKYNNTSWLLCANLKVILLNAKQKLYRHRLLWKILELKVLHESDDYYARLCGSSEGRTRKTQKKSTLFTHSPIHHHA